MKFGWCRLFFTNACARVRGIAYTAELSQDELRRLQEVESESGLILVAYDKVDGR